MKYVGVAFKSLPIKGSSECTQSGLIFGLTFTVNFGHPHLQSLKQLSLSHQEPTQKNTSYVFSFSTF